MRGRIAILAVAAASSAGAHEPSLSRFNYREHVRPLFERHCSGCHRPEGVAPMSLLDYQEAAPWANAIQLAVLEGRMPPFLPGDEGGPFRGARSLTAEELDTIVDWAVGTTPEGGPLSSLRDAELPAGDGPDLLLSVGEVVLEEGESEQTICLPLEVPSAASGSVASEVQVVAGAPSVLRRAAVFAGRSCEVSPPLAVFLPDRLRVELSEGMGFLLPGALAVELRYVKGWGDEGQRVVDRSSLGISFTPGAEAIRSAPVTGSGLEIEKPARLVALYASGPLRVESVAPDGAVRLLLAIERFDPGWAEKYFFEVPVALPAGTTLRTSGPAAWADLR
jgi:hypothetical protein